MKMKSHIFLMPLSICPCLSSCTTPYVASCLSLNISSFLAVLFPSPAPETKTRVAQLHSCQWRHEREGTRSEPGKVTARGSEGGKAFTAGEIKDAGAKHRLPCMKGAGASRLSHSGSIKPSAGTESAV